MKFTMSMFLFVEEADMMSYTDEKTPYVCSRNVDVNLKKLEEVGEIFFEWFRISYKQILINAILL